MAAFHYTVKVKLIRYITKDNVDFINFEKSFEDEIPIVARQKAFKEYVEWIKDLYTGLGKEGQYITDRQARIDLKTFIAPTDNLKVRIDKSEIDFKNSFSYGIGVYFVIDKPYNISSPFIDKLILESSFFEDMYDKQGDELLLHGIGNSKYYNEPLEISGALNNEILYYEHYNYDKGNFERRTNFYDGEIDEVEEIEFLETPFDWTGLDVIPEIEEENEEIVEQNRIQQIEEIISKGEGNKVEFKPALLYNFNTNLPGISVKAKIATAICAFLNANGGFLFIGLDDDGDPQGLNWDFSLAKNKKPKDFFHGEFDQMIQFFLSFSIKANINGEFIKLKGKDVFIVTVWPSKSRPIFLNGQNGKEFWVRGNHGNRQLTDNEELANYCIDRWGN